MAQLFNSFFVNFATRLHTSKKKYGVYACHFWTFPQNSAHTFVANGHSQSIWLTISSWCWHIAQWASTFILHFCRLARVGRIFVQALHRKFQIFGRVLKAQIDLHTLSSYLTREWSPDDGCWSLIATLYAILTEKNLPLFSLHVKVSFACMLFKGIRKIYLHVSGSNHWAILSRSHCFVPSSTNSFTKSGLAPALRKHGVLSNRRWFSISTMVSSLIFHTDPSSMTSLARSKLLHM